MINVHNHLDEISKMYSKDVIFNENRVVLKYPSLREKVEEEMKR